ncbi:MAG TPA: RidA family protein [Citreicella sp.]|jgi:enamine deaminase RidA (YjgF/YER057c/UK114 family)|uniref:Enamine deaminase RidA, house cleaning of reactive enamine intermediates, YjgF/YER057c/UK114 family n=1 Tax=Salipiger marinus TaxID=555512 RepID=A0A1G8JM99_9RHOB|nr:MULTISPECIES: RidA family protein [Salipiger]MCD1619961.1 RidA family protein [Salipiger manganoxidans]SDI32173.1 Enamine deaminase RidA, house cleaning of reactive enamine intermediates, YjgF/YER057c/UK114 family [Salipiger marinus]HBM58029.1 RidA family protein [Citreicella sp.]HBT00446.1 RidA family protein [Citreicella sp.]
MDPIEQRLAELGLSLPPSAPSRALFLPGKISGNLLFLSGQICEWEGVPQYFGPVAEGFDMDTGQAAARMCALNLLYSIKTVAGSLSRVSSVIRLGGFVAAPPGYGEGPFIVNGASQLFIDLYGEAGRHARTAVNVASLPANALVEIDAVVELG